MFLLTKGDLDFVGVSVHRWGHPPAYGINAKVHSWVTMNIGRYIKNNRKNIKNETQTSEL